MDRRTFLACSAALAATPALAEVEYTPGLVEKELAAGKTLFLEFAAVWCTTCKAQEAKIEKLKRDNPDYEANITFIRVDWDQYGNSGIARRLNIPRRSTLVVLKGKDELGRIVAGTSTKAIKGLMDTALKAAMAA